MTIKKNKTDQLEAVLPQTQCRLCDYPGCRPYAAAIAEGEADIDRCHPGGLETLKALAKIQGKDYRGFIDKVQQQTKAASSIWIDPELCIGCTKCIQVCPVDAIIGKAKEMHTVLPSECTGCDLCIPVCPVDCMIPIPTQEPSTPLRKSKAAYAKMRFEQRQNRLGLEEPHALLVNSQQQATIATETLEEKDISQTMEALKKRSQQQRKVACYEPG
jgi:Na+-translocating ferredoxin:NAD+ oxidoreductase subunit B